MAAAARRDISATLPARRGARAGAGGEQTRRRRLPGGRWLRGPSPRPPAPPEAAADEAEVREAEAKVAAMLAQAPLHASCTPHSRPLLTSP